MEFDLFWMSPGSNRNIQVFKLTVTIRTFDDALRDDILR